MRTGILATPIFHTPHGFVHDNCHALYRLPERPWVLCFLFEEYMTFLKNVRSPWHKRVERQHVLVDQHSPRLRRSYTADLDTVYQQPPPTHCPHSPMGPHLLSLSLDVLLQDRISTPYHGSFETALDRSLLPMRFCLSPTPTLGLQVPITTPTSRATPLTPLRPSRYQQRGPQLHLRRRPRRTSGAAFSQSALLPAGPTAHPRTRTRLPTDQVDPLLHATSLSA